MEFKKYIFKIFEVKRDNNGKIRLSKFQQTLINFCYDELKQQTPFLESKLKGLISWLRNSVIQQEQKRNNKVGIIAYFDEKSNDFVFEIRDISVRGAEIDIENNIISRHRGIKIIADIVSRLKKSRDWQHLQDLMKEDIFASDIESNYEEATYEEVSQEHKLKESPLQVQVKKIPAFKLLDVK